MSGTLTGRHVLAILLAFFGVVIAVNLLLAVKAVSTFPGLEVDNSYVASQTFNQEKAAQLSLGWTLTHSYDVATRSLKLDFRDGEGHPAVLGDLSVLVGRPTEAKDDQTPAFVDLGGVHVAQIELAPGKWMMHVVAHAPDGTLFRQRLDLFVRG